MRLRFSHIPVFLAALWCAGCCTCSEQTRSGVSPQPAATFSIDLSSGGGFSGMHTGFSLLSTGAVRYWRGMHGRADETFDLGTVQADTLHALKRLIDSLQLRTLPIKETGNMTTRLAVTEGETIYALTWPGIESDAGVVPATVTPVHEMLQRLIAPFREHVRRIDAPK